MDRTAAVTAITVTSIVMGGLVGMTYLIREPLYQVRAPTTDGYKPDTFKQQIVMSDAEMLIFRNKNLTLALTLLNPGSLADRIDSISIEGAIVVPVLAAGYHDKIETNVKSLSTKYLVDTSATTFKAGQLVSFTVYLASGKKIPWSVIVKEPAVAIVPTVSMVPPKPSPGQVIFREGFEYAGSITENGWQAISTAGSEQTQTLVYFEGTRAVKLIDNSAASGFSYLRHISPQRYELQVDYYMRAEQYGISVGFVLGGDGIGILTELSDARKSFRVQDKFYFQYLLNQWYHVRLLIRIQEKSYDVYVDDMSGPLDANLRFTDSYFDKLHIGTGSSGTGVGYWDGIVVRSGGIQEDIQPTSIPTLEELRRRTFEYLTSFEARDTSRTLSYYSKSTNVIVKWEGQAGAFAGVYRGSDNVRTLVRSLFGNTDEMHIVVNKYQPSLDTYKATVFMSLTIAGRGKLTGAFKMDIDTYTTWEFADGQWVMLDETWRFTGFSTEYVGG